MWTIAPNAADPAWTDVTPDPNIMPRWAAGGAVSPAGDLYVVGGVNEHYSLLADVWKLHVAGPHVWQGYEDLYPPRLQEVMVLDPTRHRLVAMGGTDGSYRNDVYVHALDSGRGWAPVNPTGARPAPRRLHTAIWDTGNDRMLVFGGFDGGFYNDVWELAFSGAGAAWKQLDPTGTPPSPRAGHVAIYDPVGQRMIVSHGYDGVTSPNFRVADTWALSLSGPLVWTRLDAAAPPPARSSASAVYDAARRRLVLFGGTTPSYRNDAWALDLAGAPVWSAIAPAGTIAAREEHGAVYDVARDRMVIFGGYDQAMPYYHLLGDLAALTFDGTSAWWGLEPAGAQPSPRWGMKTVYDAEADGMWLYGGWDGSYSQQLWFLQWPNPQPPAFVATTQAAGLADRAALEWQLPALARNAALVQRSDDGVHWRPLARLLPHALALPFTDRTVAAGRAYAYRTVVTARGGDMASQAVWVNDPGRNHGRGARCRQRGSRCGTAGPRGAGPAPWRCAATRSRRGESGHVLELLDVAGRVRDARTLLRSGPGETARRTRRFGLEAAGVYFARLVQGPRVATLKAGRAALDYRANHAPPRRTRAGGAVSLPPHARDSSPRSRTPPWPRPTASPFRSSPCWLALASASVHASAPDRPLPPVLRSTGRVLDVRENGILRRGGWTADPSVALDELVGRVRRGSRARHVRLGPAIRSPSKSCPAGRATSWCSSPTRPAARRASPASRGSCGPAEEAARWKCRCTGAGITSRSFAPASTARRNWTCCSTPAPRT
ncbi:MAG: kelch repeat-containing protein [Candidatus Eisenbacteria bacterium]